MKRMTREHEDVLQNIEFVLVNAHRDNPKIDDRIVHEAIVDQRSGTAASHPLAIELVAALAGVREFREDITDEVWLAGLKVVDDSVRRHSRLTPGDRAYLQFASKFTK